MIVLPGYRILERTGAGASAAVYRVSRRERFIGLETADQVGQRINGKVVGPRLVLRPRAVEGDSPLFGRARQGDLQCEEISG